MCTLRTIYDTIAYRKKMDTAIRVSGGQESRLYFMKENNCKMTELPADELPYEKCINKGAEVLSDAELLAVILRTGSKGINALELSRKILDAGAPRNGLLGLYHMTIPQLCQIRGIGEVKAVQLKCIAGAFQKDCRSIRLECPELQRCCQHCRLFYGGDASSGAGADDSSDA